MGKEFGVVACTSREINVGERIRELRLGLGLSVRTLAARAEFSPSFISQVELGQASPSIASLERIVAVLGLRLGGFFGEVTAEPAEVVREEGRRRLTSSWSRAEVEALAPSGARSHLQPVMLTLAPGGHSGKYDGGRAGDHFAIVFEGEVKLTLGDRIHTLRRGDAVTFRSEERYTWENESQEPVRVVLVSTQ